MVEIKLTIAFDGVAFVIGACRGRLTGNTIKRSVGHFESRPVREFLAKTDFKGTGEGGYSRLATFTSSADVEMR